MSKSPGPSVASSSKSAGSQQQMQNGPNGIKVTEEKGKSKQKESSSEDRQAGALPIVEDVPNPGGNGQIKDLGDGPPRRPRGIRILDIPQSNCAVTIEGSKPPFDQIKIVCGLNIVIDLNYQAIALRNVRPSWDGPWCKVDVTRLEVDSNFVGRKTHQPSSAQIHMTVVSSGPDSVTPLAHTPPNLPSMTAPPSPTSKFDKFLDVFGEMRTADQRVTSSARTETNRDGKPLAKVYWMYTHPNIVSQPGRLKRWVCDYELLPSATFAFHEQAPPPLVQLEILVSWDQRTARARCMPFRRSISATDKVPPHFGYTVAISVDLNDIREDGFFYLPVRDITDSTTWDKISDGMKHKRGSISFGTSTGETAEETAEGSVGSSRRSVPSAGQGTSIDEGGQAEKILLPMLPQDSPSDAQE